MMTSDPCAPSVLKLGRGIIASKWIAVWNVLSRSSVLAQLSSIENLSGNVT